MTLFKLVDSEKRLSTTVKHIQYQKLKLRFTYLLQEYNELHCEDLL